MGQRQLTNKIYGTEGIIIFFSGSADHGNCPLKKEHKNTNEIPVFQINMLHQYKPTVSW